MPKPDPSDSSPSPSRRRQDHEYPAAIARDGWRFHHLGIPTRRKRPEEEYLPRYGMYVSGFDTSPYGVEWMRFEEDCPLPELVKNIPHLAFVVDDLDAAMAGREILLAPGAPSEGVRTAMIVDDGAPIELMEFTSREG
jgi:hypothetical protein